MSQHNSQSSVASSSTVDDDEEDEESVETEEMIFALIDYWSLNFTGDLHYPDTLHLVMEILEKLRQKNKVSVSVYAASFCVSHFSEKLGTTEWKKSDSRTHICWHLAKGSTQTLFLDKLSSRIYKTSY